MSPNHASRNHALVTIAAVDQSWSVRRLADRQQGSAKRSSYRRSSG
jgi:hypothetical protein